MVHGLGVLTLIANRQQFCHAQLTKRQFRTEAYRLRLRPRRLVARPRRLVSRPRLPSRLSSAAELAPLDPLDDLAALTGTTGDVVLVQPHANAGRLQLVDDRRGALVVLACVADENVWLVSCWICHDAPPAAVIGRRVSQP